MSTIELREGFVDDSLIDDSLASIFRPVIRRLNDAERAMYIRSGSVFVWEETEEAIGLRRVSVLIRRRKVRVLTRDYVRSSGQTA